MLKEFPTAADHEIADAIAASHAAFQTWRATPIEHRTEPIRRAADLMEERIDELSKPPKKPGLLKRMFGSAGDPASQNGHQPPGEGP